MRWETHTLVVSDYDEGLGLVVDTLELYELEELLQEILEETEVMK